MTQKQLKQMYFTTEEARCILGLADTAIVRSYIASGYLKGKKFGRRWLVKRDSLEDKLSRQSIVLKR